MSKTGLSNNQLRESLIIGRTGQCCRLIQKLFAGLLAAVLVFVFPTPLLAADCPLSPYTGRATLNEFFKDQSNQANDPDDFAEIKILDSTITPVIFDNWEIQICERDDPGNNRDDDGCSGYVSVSTFTDKSPPWIVLKDGNIGRFVNFNTAFDAVLLDENNNVIDYLTYKGYGGTESLLGCTVPVDQLPYPYSASAPGGSFKFLSRVPDGIGEWQGATSAAEPPSESDTNDEAPDGPAPTINVENITVSKGETAVFTLVLEGAPKSYDVSVNYATLDGTAVAGTDYIYTSGTATIPAGDGSTTVSVSTILTSPSGIVYFYLYLNEPVNATVGNHYPTGTILAPPAGLWYMDEPFWSGTADEVNDSSNNNNHGTAYNGLTTEPGFLCNGGRFDGINDYIEIPHSSTLNGSSGLTYMAWVNPDEWSGINQIMAKSVHGGGSGRAQMGIFSESGVLKGRAETLAGRYEVSTALPVTGTWTHLALVFSATELRLYVNGEIAASKGFASTSLVQTTDPLMISKRYPDNTYYFKGYIDEVLLVQSTLPASLLSNIYHNYLAGLNWDGTMRSCPGLLHHLNILHDGNGLTCSPETVTVQACVDPDCDTLYPGNVDIQLQVNGSSVQTASISGGSGTVDFRHTSPATVTLDALAVNPPASAATRCFNAGVESCQMVFAESGFVFDIPTQIANRPSGPLSLRAVKADPLDPQSCTPGFIGDKAIRFWSSYADPATGTQPLSVNATPIAGSSPGTPITLSFDANAEAQIELHYADAGLLQIDARYEGIDEEAGLVMQGNQQFVVVPVGMCVQSLDANADCASADANCSAFRRAGEAFNLNVAAVAWESDADTDLCSGNLVTGNFRMNDIVLASTLVSPVAGQAGVPGLATLELLAADNGGKTVPQSISEVGVFSFSATPAAGAYHGQTVPGGLSPPIGRFTPHYFEVAVTPACSTGMPFTYSGQAFSADIVAYNLAGAVTRNYAGDFVKAPILSNAGDEAGFSNHVFGSADFTAGEGTRNDVTYTFAAKLGAPLDMNEIRAIDADGISSETHAEGSNHFRSGRVVLDNAYGSEFVDLRIGMRSEYYDGSGFVLNTADSCGVGITLGLGPSDLDCAISTDNLCIGDGTARRQTCLWDNGSVGGNLSGANGCDASGPAAPSDLQYTGIPVTGAYTLYLKAPDSPGGYQPNNPIFGRLTVRAQLPAFLQYDWDGDGDHDDDAQSTAAFGQYRGDDRIIYWLEVFN